MSHASITIALCFLSGVALFAGWTAYMVHDSRRVRVGPNDQALLGRARTMPPVNRVRLAVVVVTFFVWSLMLSEHLRPRR
jgi:hypothetical protein